MKSQSDFADSPPPNYQSGFSGKLDLASEDDGTQTSVEERSMDGNHDLELITVPTMRRKDILCLLGVILAFILLYGALQASIWIGILIVGPYCTATSFIQTNCSYVSSTMGIEMYNCSSSCGNHCGARGIVCE